MKFEIAKEDIPHIPMAIAGVIGAVALGTYVIHTHFSERKARKQIRQDRDATLSEMREETEKLVADAETKHRQRMEEILSPLRDQGLIDF